MTVPGARAGGSGSSRSGVSPRARTRPARAWADPAALAWLSAGGRGTHRTTLLSPFDSLIWDRKRTLRMFGYRHLFEPYVPKEKRERGYFTMPLLAGGQIMGWVDPGRDGQDARRQERAPRKARRRRAHGASPRARPLSGSAARM